MASSREEMPAGLLDGEIQLLRDPGCDHGFLIQRQQHPEPIMAGKLEKQPADIGQSSTCLHVGMTQP